VVRVPHRHRKATVFAQGRECNTKGVQDAFGTVVFVVCAVGVVGALVALVFNRSTWEHYGRDHLLLDSDLGRASSGTSMGSAAERDLEIRQMLEARNARRAARGEPALDVDAEVARLTVAPAIDPALEAEIRSMVLARNARRERQGKPPLDVEAEVRRQVAEFSGA
jgi:hypothetical protein